MFAALLLASCPVQELTPPELGPGRDAIEVDTSILVTDVIQVYDARQTVQADVYYRLSWLDERLASEDEEIRVVPLDTIWRIDLQPIRPRGLTKLLPELASIDAEGRVTYTQRLTGEFGSPTYLKDFPFDEHKLRIAFLYSVGARVPIEPVEGQIVEVSKTLTIPNWTITNPRLLIEDVQVSEQLPPLPAVALEVDAKRNSSYYLTSILFPLLVIVMMSWTVFWAPPTAIAIQFGFAATSILTIIAYRFALANQIPPVPYTTRLDKFLNGSFILTFLALVEVIVTARLLYREKSDVAERIDVACRWLFPLALAAIGARAFLL